VARPNPLGAAVAAKIADADFEEAIDNGDEDALKLIHGELTAGSTNNKEIGCYKLAMIADKMHAQILELKMVKMVAPLMVDQKDGVQISAIGALKNLSLVSEEVCEEMIKQDVMTPLCQLISSYGEKEWRAGAAVEGKDQVDVTKEVFVEGVQLLSNLCEASSVAVDTFNKNNGSGLIACLLNHLDVSKFGHQVATAVLQCVYSVSENNPPVVQALKEKEAVFSQLLSSAATSNDPSELYVRILACGVIMNVSREATVLAPIMTTVANVLNQDHRKKASEFTDLIPLEGVKKGRGKKNGSSKEEGSEEKLAESERQTQDAENVLKDVLLGQQTALEILANLCCEENDNDADMSSDMSDDNSSVNGDGDDDEGDDVQEEGMEVSYVPSISADITEAISSRKGLVQAVLASANLPAENVMEILLSVTSPGVKTVVKLLSALRVRAFLCLNNLVGALTLDDLGGPDALFNVWSNLGLLCFKDQEDSKRSIKPNEELLESATSAMRSATQKLLESKCYSHFNGLSASDLEQMIRFGAASPFPTVRINMVQIIGSIGLALASTSASGAAAASMANFLLEAAAKDADLRVVAEALDKLFDMFAEDDTDQLSVDVGLVPKLKQLLPGFKAKVGMARKSAKGQKAAAAAADFHVIVDMAKTNLLRFIKYKEKRPLVAASLKK